MDSKKVIIVDDNSVLKNTLVLFFKMKGFQVFAFDKIESLKSFILSEKVEKVDLAIIDYNLEENENGEHIADFLRKRYVGIKIILISGFFPPSFESVVSDKNYELLSKPFDIYELTDVLKKIGVLDA